MDVLQRESLRRKKRDMNFSGIRMYEHNNYFLCSLWYPVFVSFSLHELRGLKKKKKKDTPTNHVPRHCLYYFFVTYFLLYRDHLDYCISHDLWIHGLQVLHRDPKDGEERAIHHMLPIVLFYFSLRYLFYFSFFF